MQGFANVIKWLIFAVLAALGIVLWTNADRLHVYKKYFFEKSPSISLRYEDLSADMGEAETLKHFAGAGASLHQSIKGIERHGRPGLLCLH